ncbi:sugar-binding transcriptional regulator [Parvimonas sp. D9]|uniref:sugar-binding transcriptional regulator n=1 Tax=Parvimonas sp. D9 TaxID=3110689 RepID=UPI002B4942FF|nr:sugar-binding domain-containing protein [Parvimonas sp. D9]MEB3058005.1 sugar-binding domain-containing protein [Parvimonas sp. D9]
MMGQKDIDYIKKFAPDLVDKFIFRYKILEYISLNAPVGRRNISAYLGVGERIVRNELYFFTDEKIVEVIKSGTFITNLGLSMLEELREIINIFNENQAIADDLRKKLEIKKVIICDSYEDEFLGKEQIAKVASEYFLNIISENDVIGISGGTTVKSFVDIMNVKKFFKNISVIPARGSLGNGLEYQSNVVANNLSKKLGANFFGTFLPDYLDDLTFDRLKDLEEVKTLIEYLNKINILVFGIGRADAMAKRRSLTEDEINILNEKNAVSEAFGNYFDIDGNAVYSSNTIGLDMEQYLKIKEVIAIAGYGEKYKAIISICNIRKDMTLVTDKESAKKILNIL